MAASDGLLHSRFEELLKSLFTQDELERFVGRGPRGKFVLRQVHAKQSFDAYAAEIVDALDRNGLISEAWFDRLGRERSYRLEDINAVRTEWRSSLKPRPTPFLTDEEFHRDAELPTRNGRSRIVALSGLVAAGIIALAVWSAPGSERPDGSKGFVTVEAEDRAEPTGVQNQEFIALLFAASDYGADFEDLRTPSQDITRIGQILKERFGFEVRKHVNATRKVIIDELDELAHRQENASVVIYFAGHGIYKDELGKGFWIPTDATHNSTASWVSNADVLTRVEGAKARHVLVISDSCFSGTLLRSQRGSPEARSMAVLQNLARKRSRIVVTSGGVQPVLDTGTNGMSIFAFRLHELLRSTDRQYVIFPGDLFEALRRQVANDTQGTVQQTPERGTLISAGHAGGEMVLVRTDAKALAESSTGEGTTGE